MGFLLYKSDLELISELSNASLEVVSVIVLAPNTNSKNLVVRFILALAEYRTLQNIKFRDQYKPLLEHARQQIEAELVVNEIMPQ